MRTIERTSRFKPDLVLIYHKPDTAVLQLVRLRLIVSSTHSGTTLSELSMSFPGGGRRFSEA